MLEVANHDRSVVCAWNKLAAAAKFQQCDYVYAINDDMELVTPSTRQDLQESPFAGLSLRSLRWHHLAAC